MYSTTPWYEVRKYVSFGEWMNRTTQCIAPTLYENNRPCRYKIDVDKANDFRRYVESLPDGLQRDMSLEDFLLTLCCDNGNVSHRTRLGSHMGAETLAQLVQDYGREISLSTATNIVTRASPYRVVRPQAAPVAEFIRFRPGPRETVTVQQELEKGMDTNVSEVGVIYCAAWPQSPGFVKIGYSSGLAEDRVSQQRSCLVGATVEASFRVAFPEQIERLVHRELHDFRRQKVACDGCRVAHKEFFEIPVEHAVQIMWEWYQLTKLQPLYDVRRTLQAYWRSKIPNLIGDITAHRLLSIVNARDKDPVRYARTASSAPLPSTDDLEAQLVRVQLNSAESEPGPLDQGRFEVSR